MAKNKELKVVNEQKRGELEREQKILQSAKDQNAKLTSENEKLEAKHATVKTKVVFVASNQTK